MHIKNPCTAPCHAGGSRVAGMRQRGMTDQRNPKHQNRCIAEQFIKLLSQMASRFISQTCPTTGKVLGHKHTLRSHGVPVVGPATTILGTSGQGFQTHAQIVDPLADPLNGPHASGYLRLCLPPCLGNRLFRGRRVGEGQYGDCQTPRMQTRAWTSDAEDRLPRYAAHH